MDPKTVTLFMRQTEIHNLFMTTKDMPECGKKSMNWEMDTQLLMPRNSKNYNLFSQSPLYSLHNGPFHISAEKRATTSMTYEVHANTALSSTSCLFACFALHPAVPDPLAHRFIGFVRST